MRESFCVLGLLFLLAVTGCAQDGSSTSGVPGATGNAPLGPPPVEPAVQALDLELKPKAAKQLSKAEQEFLLAYKVNSVEASALLDLALFEKYLNLSEKSKRERSKLRGSAEAFFAELVSPSATLLKTEYEPKLEASLSRAIVYNRNDDKPFSLLKSAKMQCYSGTSFFELARRFSKGVPQSERAHAVLIATVGHVLPGYMARGADGKWTLMGIETTEAGLASRSYGAAEALKGTIRVLHADYYAILELYSKVLRNKQAVLEASLKLTAARYGIPEAELFLKVDVKRFGKSVSATGNPFFFGGANVPEGDLERASPMLVVPRIELPVVAPLPEGAAGTVEMVMMAHPYDEAYLQDLNLPVFVNARGTWLYGEGREKARQATFLMVCQRSIGTDYVPATYEQVKSAPGNYFQFYHHYASNYYMKDGLVAADDPGAAGGAWYGDFSRIWCVKK